MNYFMKEDEDSAASPSFRGNFYSLRTIQSKLIPFVCLVTLWREVVVAIRYLWDPS